MVEVRSVQMRDPRGSLTDILLKHLQEEIGSTRDKITGEWVPTTDKTNRISSSKFDPKTSVIYTLCIDLPPTKIPADIPYHLEIQTSYDNPEKFLAVLNMMSEKEGEMRHMQQWITNDRSYRLTHGHVFSE